jgi:hypothetical protein
MFKTFFIFLFIFLGFSSTSYAYLDPGSLSIALQFLALIITGIVTFWTFLKNSIKNFFKKIKIYKRENKKD